MRRSAWIGLGGNLGDVRDSLRGALDALDARDDTDIVRVSPLYETPPWGVEDQPRFLNACAELRTDLEPDVLLGVMHEIEERGRRRRDLRWGPRTIDLDLLFYDGFSADRADLVVPHPRIAERAFVVVPLADIAPGLILDGRTIAERAAVIDRAGMVALGDWYR